MESERIQRMLPIGSIVTLKEGKRRLMIMGRLHQRLSDGKVFDYAGCLYPEGFSGEKDYYLFDHLHIDTIWFKGYQDAEENQYRSWMEEALQQHPFQ